MSRPFLDSETQTAEPYSQPWTGPVSEDLVDAQTGQWLHSQLPLLHRLLDQLDDEDLPPQQRVRALRILQGSLLETVQSLSRLDGLEADPKVSPLTPSPTPAQRLLDRLSRNLDHLLLALDRRRFGAGPLDNADRRWTIRQLFGLLGEQIEHGILYARPLPPRTWLRLHDLFAYLMARGGLMLGTGGSVLGRGFDPETFYKRLLLLGLCPRLVGARPLDEDVSNQLMRWAIESRVEEPAGRLGEYGLIVVETSRDAPAQFREPPQDDPWRGWVLEPPAEFLAFAGIRRPALSLADLGADTRALGGGNR